MITLSTTHWAGSGVTEAAALSEGTLHQILPITLTYFISSPLSDSHILHFFPGLNIEYDINGLENLAYSCLCTAWLHICIGCLLTIDQFKFLKLFFPFHFLLVLFSVLQPASSIYLLADHVMKTSKPITSQRKDTEISCSKNHENSCLVLDVYPKCSTIK